MKLELTRTYKCENYTIGRLSVDGQYFCDTLEDAVRELPASCPDTPQGRDCRCAGKVAGRTAIPAGDYRVTVAPSPRFGQDMIRVLDVPHFRGILIHAGNTEEDTAGCILVGRNTAKGRLTASSVTATRLKKRVAEECARKRPVSLSVKG